MIGIVVILIVAIDGEMHHAIVGADVNVIVAVVQVLVQMGCRDHTGEIDGRFHALAELVALHIKGEACTDGIAIRLEADGQRTGVVVDGRSETVGTFGRGVGIVHPAQQGSSDVGAIVKEKGVSRVDVESRHDHSDHDRRIGRVVRHDGQHVVAASPVVVTGTAIVVNDEAAAGDRARRAHVDGSLC